MMIPTFWPKRSLLVVLALGLAACSSGNSDEAGDPGTDPNTQAPLEITETEAEVRVCDDTLCFDLNREPMRYAVSSKGGAVLFESASTDANDPIDNRDYARDNDVQDGIDRAYPGLPQISYRPLAYFTDQWQFASGVDSVRIDGRTARFTLQTSDTHGAELSLGFADDGSLSLHYAPMAPGVVAVEDALAHTARGYYGAGQRFSFFEMSGERVPLWISHGGNADGAQSTNEIAAPFFWTPDGWGLWAQGDARGEMTFAQNNERDDAINVMRESAELQLRFYTGTPQRIVSQYTAESGRPRWTPPDWMWTPMVWQDSDTSTDSVRALVNGMRERDIPLGAVWLDNPWDAGKGSFDFDPNRFDDPDALIEEVHAQGVRFIVWMSPFMTGDYESFAEERGWLVTGTREDGNDATYYPTRGIDPHLDFTHPDAVDWWRGQLENLIARGVDGLKMDRCEEDLSDSSAWFNGLPNRDNHNGYCGRYHRTAYEAFIDQRPDGDFVLLARGGWSGGAQWTGHWAADNLSVSGELGLVQALRSLLSLSASGFPYNGADIGGYAGTRQDLGEDGPRLGLPGEATYVRWTQLGALSPVMQTDVPPWWVTQRAVDSYRRYAELHNRLVPYTAHYARQAIETGVPIVRPMAYAFPDDDQAASYPDQYLYGDHILVSPIVSVALELFAVAKPVYLPAGTWVDFWTGDRVEGPGVRTRLYPLDEMPLYVREGAQLPDGVSADALP